MRTGTGRIPATKGAIAITKSASVRTPYYGHIARSTEGGFDLWEIDRILATGSAAEGSPGLKGKRATNCVVEKFEESKIIGLTHEKAPGVTAKARLGRLRGKHE